MYSLRPRSNGNVWPIIAAADLKAIGIELSSSRLRIDRTLSCSPCKRLVKRGCLIAAASSASAGAKGKDGNVDCCNGWATARFAYAVRLRS
jgi:hypothetical protein